MEAEEVVRQLLVLLACKRRKLGLSQAQLAERLKTYRPKITCLEAGDQKLSVVDLICIANELQISNVALFNILLLYRPSGNRYVEAKA